MNSTCSIWWAWRPGCYPGGELLGRVTNLLHAGNDLLELDLTPERGGRRILVPFVQAIVPEVHLAEGWIGLTPPPGLLEL